jgi:Flp pilus assembly protein TadG
MVTLKTSKRGQRAQAVVELAIILPVLLMVLMGIIEFGRVFMAQQTITNASREGARLGVLPISTISDVESVVSTFMGAAGLTGSIITSTTNVGPDVETGLPTSVTVQYDLPILTGTIIPVLGQTISLSHTTVMRHE